MARRLLVIDDNQKVLDIVRHFLEPKGYTVTTEANAEVGLEKARAETFDVIILDVVLNGTDGYNVCSRLKNDRGTADIPILFVSAKLEIAELFLRQFDGIADFLAKPFRREELISKLDHLFVRKQESKRPVDSEASKRTPSMN